jgi:TolB protein
MMLPPNLIPAWRLSRRALLAGGSAVLAAPCLGHAQSLLGGAGAPPVGAPPLGAPAPGPSAAAPAGAAGTPPVELNQPHAEAIPIAIPPLGGGPLGAQIASVVSNDLQSSGLFRVVDPATYGGVADTGPVPNFNNWKALGVQALVTGNAVGGGRVEFRLWDVLPGQQAIGTAFSGSESAWRRIAHKISDAIYQRLIGDKGYFDTRVVYISETGPKDRRTKRLAIMDQDGANNQFLTSGSFNALTPRFAPNSNEIAFMSYANNRPRVYLFNLSSGSQRLLGDFSHMTLSPRFSPDGSSIVLSEAVGGGANIYVVGLNGGSRQLTDSGAIDVSPCYSPDGAQIVFNSDRGGDQQLYVMSADGGGAHRISFGNGRYATPVWSPRGDLIAFTRFGGSTFAIGVMRPDGSGERTLYQSYYVEGPTFCPNGRVIMFYRQTASDSRGGGYSSRLLSINITGFNEREILTPTDASDPSWGPLLT